MNDNDLERELQKKGLTAPRVTREKVESIIVDENYINAGEATGNAALCTLTICVLTLKNGFVVTGESACASPENFDQSVGERRARENASDKVWLLEGYLLKDKLALGIE